MDKIKIKIKDTSFQHCSYSNNPMPPVSFCEHMEWDWSNPLENELTFYTHSTVNESFNDKNTNKVCWLLEPYDFVPTAYEIIKKHNNDFKYVFTHEKSLIDLGDNFKFIPFGGCWIEPEDRKLHPKNKLVSIIASNKFQLEGHKIRHHIIATNKEKLDIFGNGYNYITKKIEGLGDYKFSVVIENCKRDYWFTEKLIDCLITGTVPIYWGCPSIGDFFDTRGFIIIDDVDNISKILNDLSVEKYESMLPYIEKNLELSKNFTLGENHIYNDYIKTGLL